MLIMSFREEKKTRVWYSVFWDFTKCFREFKVFQSYLQARNTLTERKGKKPSERVGAQGGSYFLKLQIVSKLKNWANVYVDANLYKIISFSQVKLRNISRYPVVMWETFGNNRCNLIAPFWIPYPLSSDAFSGDLEYVGADRIGLVAWNVQTQAWVLTFHC